MRADNSRHVIAAAHRRAEQARQPHGRTPLAPHQERTEHHGEQQEPAVDPGQRPQRRRDEQEVARTRRAGLQHPQGNGGAVRASRRDSSDEIAPREHRNDGNDGNDGWC